VRGGIARRPNCAAAELRAELRGAARQNVLTNGMIT
jgi:hypothetical protein